MQLIFSAGFAQEWQGAVRANSSISKSRNIDKAIIAILTLKRVARSSAPPSLYVINAGGTFFLFP